MKPLRILLLHSPIPLQATEDELDTLEQVQEVSRTLMQLGHQVLIHVFPAPQGADPMLLLRENQLDLIFNLVEESEGKAELNYLLPLLLQYHQVPFTGANFQALVLTSDKLITKRLLAASGIATPPWFSFNPADQDKHDQSSLYLPKPVHGDASQGIHEDKLQLYPFGPDLLDKLRKLERETGKAWFAEAFVEGREFNISLVQENGKARVLPPAEILFNNFPAGKLQIVGYKAKWDAHSFEYQNTPRTFAFSPRDLPLHERLHKAALACWDTFSLSGYARVDFRVNNQGIPQVLEINANPCIGPENGFASAAAEGGLDYGQLLTCVITAALNNDK